MRLNSRVKKYPKQLKSSSGNSGLDCLCFNGKECSNYDDDGKLFDCSAIETIDYNYFHMWQPSKNLLQDRTGRRTSSGSSFNMRVRCDADFFY